VKGYGSVVIGEGFEHSRSDFKLNGVMSVGIIWLVVRSGGASLSVQSACGRK
jgi:hypothetical protein